MKKRILLISLSVAILFMLTLTTAQVLGQVHRGAAVPAEQLPEGLKELEIRDYFIESDSKRVGVIHALRGTVVVVHKATKEAYFGVEGDYVYENDSLETLPDSRCRIKLLNEDVISMAPTTHLEVDEVVFKREKREKRSFLSMLKGKAMVYSLRLFSFKKLFTKLRTPTAVVGVRGTKFAVHVYEKHERKAALKEIRLAYFGDSVPYLAALEEGETGTDVIFYDGTGDVDGVEVGPGEKYQDGVVKGATKEEMQAFEQDTAVEEEVVAVEEVPEAPVDTGEPEPESDAEIAEEIVSIASEQTGGVTEEAGQAELSRVYGYFSAFLSGYCSESGSYYFADIYRSLTRQDFGSLASAGTVEGYNANNEKMVAMGQGAWEELTPYLQSLKHGGKSSGDLGTTRPIIHGELGHNDYLQWGWWYVRDPFPISSDFAVYHPDNLRQGYYIFGPNPADIGALSGSYYYSGDAYGTFYGSNELMKGEFNCQLNFNTSSVTDFDLEVAGENYRAYILDASGNLTSGSNHIDLDYTHGSWMLGPKGSEYSASYGDAKGSVYGNGNAAGGVWKMGHTSYGYHAAGIYEGTKTTTAPQLTPTVQSGYFAALLSIESFSSDYADTYRSLERQDFKGNTMEGYAGDTTGTDKMLTTGQGAWEGGTPYLKSVEVSGTSSGDLGTNHPITYKELGHNDYLKWGWWNASDKKFSISDSYAVYHPDNDRQGYYIFGPHPADIGALSGSYNYSGDAYGTFYGSNVAMQGTSNCTLNFDTLSVTDFDLSVSGGGHSASILDATGSLTPGGNHIHLTTSVGTWLIGSTSSTADSGDVRGSVYGPNGEAVGGVWKMGYGGDYAAGIFEGTR